MRKISVLILCLILALSAACNKELKDQLAELQDRKTALEEKVSELPEAAEIQPSDFCITFDNEDCWVDAGCSAKVHYSLDIPAKVEASSEHGWSVEVTPSSDNEGDVIITAPDPASPGIVKVKATNSNGYTTETFSQLFVRKPYGTVASPRIEAMAYNGLTDDLATPEHFRKMAEAGFTMVSVEGEDEIYGPGWRNQCIQAAEAGIKVVLFIGWTWERWTYDPEHFTGLDDLINEAETYPAICAYQIADEPTTYLAPTLAKVKAKINQLAPDHPVYINLHPSSVSQAGMGAVTYEEYVECFASVCDLQFITFDHYPLFTYGIEDCWYRSLNAVYDTAKRHGIPFWAFLLSCREWGRVEPSLENIRLQGNMNLTYGAQVNQFFVYRSTSGTEQAPLQTWKWKDGIPGGTKVGMVQYTPFYDYCKEYCREMHNREFVFAGSDVRKVRHTGNNYYLHGECLSTADLPEAISDITTYDSAAVSFIGNSGNEYVVICNKAYDKKLPVSVTFTREVYTIDREGEFALQQPGNTLFTIDEGDMLVIKWK